MSPKFTLISVLACAALQSCASTSEQTTHAEVVSTTVPKNIIMVVSDGMGPAYTTAYRNYADDPATPTVETGVFDEILVGNASTYPAHVSGYVTDSAAAATALATGHKSYNGAIGVDADKQPVQSVLQYAKSLGMRTGITVTSQINHATPAAYMAHNVSRKNYDEIADSYYDDRINGQFVADVMLGGGTSYFERQDRDLVAQFIDAGYEYVDTYNKLATLPAGSNVLGLFAPVGLPAMLDDTRHDRLSYMTKFALRHLENQQGFFLLIEASQVDWAGHSNDIASAMGEMKDLDLTMQYLRDYVKQHPDTLVVLTADHSTGGLTVGADGKYLWKPEYLRSVKASMPMIAGMMVKEADPVAYVADQLGFDLTSEEQAVVAELAKNTDMRARESGLKTLMDKRSNTGWTTGGHTGVDVEVFAFGAGSDAFAGQIDNTDIAKTFFSYLNKHPVKPVKTEAVSTPADTKDAPGCDFKEDWRCQ